MEFSEHSVLFTIAISNVMISAFDDGSDNVTNDHVTRGARSVSHLASFYTVVFWELTKNTAIVAVLLKRGIQNYRLLRGHWQYGVPVVSRIKQRK